MTNNTTNDVKEICLDMQSTISNLKIVLANDNKVRSETLTKLGKIKSMLGEVAEELEGN